MRKLGSERLSDLATTLQLVEDGMEPEHKPRQSDFRSVHATKEPNYSSGVKFRKTVELLFPVFLRPAFTGLMSYFKIAV